VYTINGTGGLFPSYGGTSASLRYDIKENATTVRIGVSSFVAWDAKVNLTAHVQSGFGAVAITFKGDAWFRASDLAPAKVEIAASYLSYKLFVNLTTIPPPAIHWPLTTGDSWSVTSNVSVLQNFFPPYNSSSVQTASETVEPDRSLTVPAGMFTVTPLNESVAGQGNYSITYWSAAVGNAASQRSYTSNGSEREAMNLTAYNYQAGASPPSGSPLGAVVLGLPLFVWIAIVVAVVLIVAAVARVRRKPPTPTPSSPTPSAPSQVNPAGPPGPPTGP
jgi:hypothetical protein